jgi:MurNAc alpha-1-phosphate uridylyltransferase
MIDSAIVLAAGLGTRLRPLTDNTPKPLLKMGGKTMLDHALDHLAAVGTAHVVVNVHYLAEQIITHVKSRNQPEIMISDETDALLETGGAIKNALDLINRDVFFTLNADVMWPDETALTRMLQFWNPDVMDSLLLLVPGNAAIGFDGAGDYFMAANGQLTWRGANDAAPYVFASATITKADDFMQQPAEKFSQKRIWDAQEKNGRLFGITLHGPWYHCSTPEDYAAITAALP